MKLKHVIAALVGGALTGGVAGLPAAVASGAAAGVTAAIALQARRIWK